MLEILNVSIDLETTVSPTHHVSFGGKTQAGKRRYSKVRFLKKYSVKAS
jgi:hypothetical protein